jgi:hypothetical protein
MEGGEALRVNLAKCLLQETVRRLVTVKKAHINQCLHTSNIPG